MKYLVKYEGELIMVTFRLEEALNKCEEMGNENKLATLVSIDVDDTNLDEEGI